MPFCTACGHRVEEEMRFCPSCGAALPAATALAVTPTQEVAAYTAPAQDAYAQEAYVQEAYDAGLPQGDYSLVLVSCGSCTKTTARELLQETLGYTAVQARQLTNETPMELACALSFQQALDLARMYTEYGMQVSVYNSNGYVDLGLYARSSVFNESGTILASVATTLATLTAVNRVRRFLRWAKPEPLRHVFAPRYLPTPAPRPVPRFTPQPRRPAAPPHPVHVPAAPRPAQPHFTAPRPSAPAKPAGGHSGGNGGKPGGGPGGKPGGGPGGGGRPGPGGHGR